MICPDANTWNLLSMNLLDESHAESLREHCLSCERCQAAWQEASRQHTDLLDSFEAFGCNHDQRREQLMAMLPHSVPVSAKDSDIVLGTQWLGGIAMSMRRHKTRWAAVALLPAACVLIALVLMTGEKTAFADMLEKMRQAKTMTCDFVTTWTAVEGELPDGFPKDPSRGRHSVRFDGDTRAEAGEHEQAGRKTRSLMLGDKAYIWEDDKLRVMSIAELGRLRPVEDLLSRLLKFRESPDRNLGEQIIDGRRAVGFEVVGWKLGFGTRPTKGNPTPVDSDVQVRIWVDVEQDLPIRLEYDRKIARYESLVASRHRWNNIKWNVPLDPNDFRPPSEEDIAKAETIPIPAIDEVAFIDGMRAWLELKDKAQAGIDIIKRRAEERGKEQELPVSTTELERAALDHGFPERLDTLWLNGGFSARAILGHLGKVTSELKPAPKDLGPEERAKLARVAAKESAETALQAATKAARKAVSVAMFYKILANEQREPEYFGAIVKPGDEKAVLLRWKLDDGRHRVIYGDLRVESVD